MLISNRQFSGEIPKQSNRLRNTNVADVALNCELASGELRAINSFSTVNSYTGPSGQLTVHERDGNFITWAENLDVVDAPIQTGNFIFFTGLDVPRYGEFDAVRGGFQGLKVGVPAPTAIPIVIDSIVGTGFSTGDILDGFYVCTYVNDQLQEGPQSLPLFFQYKLGDEITVSFLGIDAVALVERGINTVRIYRSSSDDTQRVLSSVYPRLSSFTDNTHATLGQTLESQFNYPPPEDLVGLHIMSNGVGVGFVPNEKRILLTKNYNLHAWSYEFNVAHIPVAVTSFENTVVVLTEGNPEVATIVNPEYIVPVRLTDREPCIASRGVVQGSHGIFYPSPHGLIYIGSGGLIRVTKDHLDKADWDALNPSSFTAVHREGAYYAFYESNGARGTFVFDTEEDNATVRKLSVWGSAVTAGTGNNDMYFVDGSALRKFKGGSDKLPYLWRSSLYGDGSPFAITSRRILSPDFTVGETTHVVLRVFADGVMVHQEEVRNEKVDRITYCDRARYWYYELEGRIDITQIDLAGSASEMHTGS